MSDVIKHWIQNRLGIVFDISTPNFPANVKDGYIIARLLFSYGLLKEEDLQLIIPCNDPYTINENFRHITQWLKFIGYSITDMDHFGDRTDYTLKWLYQLYLFMHNKDKLYFITQKKYNEELPNDNPKFEVESVYEPYPEDVTIPDNDLSYVLVKRAPLIDWQRDKYKTLMEKIKTTREKYKTFIQEKFGVKYNEKRKQPHSETAASKESFSPSHVFDVEDVFSTITYDELVQEEKEALSKAAFVPNAKEARRIVNKIKQKNRKLAKDNTLKLQMEKILLHELWQHIIDRQKASTELEVTTKLLKQSVYEKQMAIKILEVRKQKMVMVQHKREIEEGIAKEREAQFIQKLFDKDEQLDIRKYAYYNERERALELHKRLYGEKQRLRTERHYNYCKECVYDLVDIAVKICDFEDKYEEKIPQKHLMEMYNLFVKEQPIFDIFDNVDEVLNYNPDDNEASNIEELYIQEIDRQNAFDVMQFEAYTNFQWPWNLEKYFQVDTEKMDAIERGMNIIGYAVHRMLLAQYPKPNRPKKPNIPTVKIAACIRGLTDMTILPTLQRLLNYQQVAVVEIQNAINYCLEAYKNESITEYESPVVMEQTETTLKQLNSKKDRKKAGNTGGKTLKDKPPKKGTKKNSKKEIPDHNDDEDLFVKKFEDKINQTPHRFPCEQLIYSPQAELGKIASDMLSLGQGLTNHLLVAMFVEYLKTLGNIYGWVLVNFPETLVQASILEEFLSGQQVPILSCSDLADPSIDDLLDIEKRKLLPDLMEDVEYEKRISSIVKDPPLPVEEKIYDTYLTAFIDIKLIKEPRQPGEQYVLDETVDHLSNFYQDQGCNYLFEYKTYDFSTVKHLAKLVLGDFRIPPKESVELFGDTLNYMEAQFSLEKEVLGTEASSKKIGEKKPKKKEKKKKGGKDDKKEEKKSSAKLTKKEKGSKTKSSKGSSKKGKKGAKSEEDIRIMVAKETQIPTPEPESDEPEEKPKPPPKPGEFGWKYISLHFPHDLQKILASLWENIEDNYVMDLREVFFRRRIVMNAMYPYVQYFRDTMREIIARPDDKQMYLSEFQKLYNSIDADLRDDDEMKAEMHCRIDEFREKLFGLCDKRMREAEEERIKIIEDDWITKQVIQMTNVYVTTFKLEMDRCIDTLQFLNDYYCGMVTQMPSECKFYEKNLLDVIPTISDPNIVEPLSTYIAYNRNAMKKENFEIYDDNPFKQTLDDNMIKGIKYIEEMQRNALAVHATLATFFATKGKKGKKQPGGKREGGLPAFTEPSQEVKDVADALLHEWETAINGEVGRALIRFQLLQAVGSAEIKLCLNLGAKVAHQIYNCIQDRYENEMTNVGLACELFGRATEAETKIQPEMILSGENFYVKGDVIMFEDDLPLHQPLEKEPLTDYIFTTDQLDDMINSLKRISKTTTILRRALKWVLMAMNCDHSETELPRILPNKWYTLTPAQFNNLIDEFFDSADVINWHHFIVNLLCVSLPTEDELLEYRQKFLELDPDRTELIPVYHFLYMELWFDKDFSQNDEVEMLRLKGIKNILIRLTQVNSESINYTALLLLFCKDIDDTRGMAKAFTLCLGKKICWDIAIGVKYINDLRNQRFEDEMKQKEWENQRAIGTGISREIVDEVVENAMNTCEPGIIIEEIIDDDMQNISKLECEEYQSVSLEFDILNNCVNEDKPDSLHKQSESSFSNINCSFEVNQHPSLVYFVDLETIIMVFTATIPGFTDLFNYEGFSLKEQIETIYNKLKTPEFYNAVFFHEFLNNKTLKKMMKLIHVFKRKDPVEIFKKFEKETN